VAPASQPSSPSDELAARRKWRGPTLADGALTAELAEFCQSGVSIVIGSCDRAGRPVVGRGLACQIDAAGKVRIVLRQPSNTALLKALEAGAAVAATFTKPSTHRSIQLKGSGAASASVTAPDGPAVTLQTSAFRSDLVDEGFAETFAAAYCAYEPHELVAIELMPEQAFVQTPGPSAGSALQP
jgi:hypothetical protein